MALWFLPRYFEVDDESPVDMGTRSAYKVEIVGVTCDPGLAVARGIWRQACCCGACRALHGFSRGSPLSAYGSGVAFVPTQRIYDK
jgi:hypothetical protein